MLKQGKIKYPPSKTPSRTKRARAMRVLLRSKNTSYTDSNSTNMVTTMNDNKENNALSTSSTNKTNASFQDETLSFISPEEYENVMEHPLYIEHDDSTQFDPEKVIIGNRIVQLGYVLKWSIQLQYVHSKQCTSGMLYVSREIRRGLGLVSHIVFKCTMCDTEIVQSTENPNLQKSVINTGAVWGTLATGSTYGHLEEHLTCMDIPCFNKYHFYKIEGELQKIWHQQIVEEMSKAGDEERRLAVENGYIDQDGVPYITVYLDGGWSKRSYGHNYNAASGVAVIIGKATGKLLFISVRNKYCTICQRAANKKETAKDHICYRNWSGSSAAMEQDIIVEGFCTSEEQHGLRYKRFVADGDSSVFANIRTKVPYGLYVEKLECTNHAVKNYGKSLHKLKVDKNVSHSARQDLKSSTIEELQKVAQAAIYNCALEGKDAEALREDFIHGICHVFGHHLHCKEYFCGNVGDTSTSKVDSIKSSGLYIHITGCLEMLLRKSTQLVDNETNNRAELFMSILARFNAGKRLHLTGRGSFQSRAEMTALRYNQGVYWHSDSYKAFTGMNPGRHFQQYLRKMQRKQGDDSKPCDNRTKILKRPRSNVLQAIPNIDYGKKAIQVEPSDEDLEFLRKQKLEQLMVTKERREEIAKLTVGQFENDLYRAERSLRLTASNFGAVIKRRASTRCHNLVKSILYPTNLSGPAVLYGKKNENVAIQLLENKIGTAVEGSGLFIDHNNCFLAASPDGLVGETHCVEVKCLPSVVQAGLTLQEATEQKKTCLEFIDGEMRLKQNHHYYYQIQGQLNITAREVCYFVIYTSDKEDIFIQEIQRDSELWENKMVPLLKRFYVDCILEEMVRKRYLRNERCFDPVWIEKAIQDKEQMVKDKASTSKNNIQSTT